MISESDWEKLKAAEVYGMYVQLDKRISKLEKVIERLLEEIKQSAVNVQRLKLKLEE